MDTASSFFNTKQPGPAAVDSLARRLPEGGNVWRTDQLAALGLNARAVAELEHAGILHRARRGCYVRLSYVQRLDAAGRDRLAILVHAHASVATASTHLVYSHVSAARLHGLSLWKADPGIHLTRTDRISTDGRATDVKIHCLPLETGECTVIDGLPVTDLLRTTVDCALTMSYRQALILMDHALRAGVPRQTLERKAAALDGHRGIRVFRAALDFASAASESAGETLTRDLIHICNIEPPELQYPLSTPVGNYRADFA